MKRALLSLVLLLLVFGALHAQPIRIGAHIIEPPNNARSLVRESEGFLGSRRRRSVEPSQLETGGIRYWLVQFSEMPTASERATLANKGVFLHDYLGSNAYYASFVSGEVGRQIKGTKIRSVIPIEGSWKVAGRIARGDIPTYALAPNGRIRVAVRFHGNAEAGAIAKALSEANLPSMSIDPLFGVSDVSLSPSEIARLADLPYVASISLVRMPASLENRESRAMNRVSAISASPELQGRALTGKGVRVGIWDSNVERHVDYGSRVAQREFESRVEDAQGHGMHVAGTVGGAGLLDPRAEGMAPGALLYTRNFNRQSNGLTVEQEMVEAARGERITITQNSYGVQLGGICELYDLLSYNATGSDLNLDLLALHFPDLTHVFAAGNDQRSCPEQTQGGYGSSTKRAKNVIYVGAVDAETRMTEFSSWGPMDDGRLLPTVSTNGNHVYSTLPKNGYGYMGGTSMACPAVSGTLALLSERYSQLHYGDKPRSALLRAIIANTADDRGNVGPDYQFGYGIVNGERAALTIERDQYKVSTLTAGEEAQRHAVRVPAGAQALRVMLVWNDTVARKEYGYGERALINDLNLEVEGNGGPYKPWVLDPHHPSAPATKGVDTTNNIEQVLIEHPSAGEYTISVSAATMASRSQEYALTWWVDAPGLRMAYPNGGERFCVGDTIVATWENGMGTSSLEISYDNGRTYRTLLRDVKGNQARVVIPDTVSTEARLRVESGGGIDASDVPFAIMPSVGEPVLLDVKEGTRLAWGKPKGERGITGYRVLRADADGGQFVLHKEIKGTDTTWLIPADSIVPSRRNIFAVAPLVGAVVGGRSKGVLADQKRRVEATKSSLPVLENFDHQPPRYFRLDTASRGRGIKYVYGMNPLVGKSAPGAHILFVSAQKTEKVSEKGKPRKPFTTKSNILTLTLDELDLTGLKKEDTVWLAVSVEQSWPEGSDSTSNNLQVRAKGANGKVDTLADAEGKKVIRPRQIDQKLRTVGFNLQEYLGGKVGLEIELSLLDSGLYTVVESIRIYRPSRSNEMEVVEIGGVADGANLSLEPLDVKVSNNSPWPASQVKVGYAVDSGAFRYETLPLIKPYTAVTHRFTEKVDLSTTRDSGQHFTVRACVDGPGDPVPENNLLERKVTNLGAVLPHPKGEVLSFAGMSLPIDPKVTEAVSGVVLYTDHGGLLGSYPPGEATLKLVPTHPGKALQARVLSFDTERGDVLSIYTCDVPANLSRKDLKPKAQLDGESEAGQIFVSQANDGGLTFFFSAQMQTDMAGWSIAVSEIERPNTFSLLAGRVDGGLDDSPLTIPIVNHSPIDHRNVPVRYILNGDTVRETIPVIGKQDTLHYTFARLLHQPNGKRYELSVEILSEADLDPHGNRWDSLWLRDTYCTISVGKSSSDCYIQQVEAFESIVTTEQSAGEVEYRTLDTLRLYKDMPDTSIRVSAYASEKVTKDEAPIVALWVDWNHDSKFDANERIAAAVRPEGESPLNACFPLPAGERAEGNYRVRVMLAPSQGLAPCQEALACGDVEDYTLAIRPSYPIAEGFAVDTIWVEERADHRYGKEERLFARVRNLGSKPLTEVRLKLKLDKGGFEKETLKPSQPIDPCRVDTVEFPRTYDLSAVGEHHFIALAEATGDQAPDTSKCDVITVIPAREGFFALDIQDKEEVIYLGLEDAALMEEATYEAWVNWGPGDLGNIYTGRGILITIFNKPQTGLGPANSVIVLLGEAKIIMTEADVIKPGTWQHIAVTQKTTSKGLDSETDVKIYVDGKEMKTTILGEGILMDDGQPLLAAPNFGGKVENLRVWQRALKGDSIAARRYRVGFEKDEDLVAEYRFDEGPGNVVSISKRDGRVAKVMTRRAAASDSCLWINPVEELVTGTHFVQQALPSKRVAKHSFKSLLKPRADISKVSGPLGTSWPNVQVKYAGKLVDEKTVYDFTKDSSISISAALELFGRQFEEKEVKVRVGHDANDSCELLTLAVGRVENPKLARDAQVSPMTSTNEVDLGGMDDLSKVIPTFTVSRGATLLVGETALVSGTSPVDLRHPVSLRVVAANGRDSKLYSLARRESNILKWELADSSFVYGDSAIALHAEGERYDYVSYDCNVATVANGKLHLVGQGKAYIAAVIPGDTAAKAVQHLVTVGRKPVTIKPQDAVIGYTSEVPGIVFDYTPLVRLSDSLTLTGALPEYNIHQERGGRWDGQGYLPVGEHLRKPIKGDAIELGNYQITPGEGKLSVTSTATRPVTFTAKDTDGKPLPGVLISLNNSSFSTNAEGKVNVDLPFESFGYEATKEGFQPRQGMVEVTAKSVDLRLPKRTLTINYGHDTNGSLVGSTRQLVAPDEVTTPVTAAPIKGFRLTRWDDNSLLNPRSDTAKKESSFKALFGEHEYRLTYKSTRGGTIKGNAEQRVKWGKNGEKVTASPTHEAYYFVRWDDGSTDSVHQAREMTDSVEFEATFSPIYGLPYRQSFDQEATTPEGWFTYAESGTTESWQYSDAPIKLGTNQFKVGSAIHAYVNASRAREQQMDACLQTPRFTLGNLANDSIRLSFRLSMGGMAGGAGTLTVQSRTDADKDWKVLGQPLQPTSKNGLQDSLVTLTLIRPKGARHATFRFRYEASDGLVMLDDVRVEAKTNGYELLYLAGEGGAVNGKTLITQSHKNGETGDSVTAQPAEGYSFVGWSDGYPHATRSDRVATVVTAHFRSRGIKAPFELAYQPEAHGAIAGSMWQPRVPAGTFGSPVRAIPEAGFRFTGWSDGVTEALRRDSVATQVVARFGSDSCTLTYAAKTGGKIEGQTTQRIKMDADGTPVRAVADSGYRFVQWSDGDTNPERADLKVTGDMNLTAAFYFDNANGVGGGEVMEELLTISPNPADGMVKVEVPLPLEEGVGYLEVYNALGSLVERVPLKDALDGFIEVDATPLPTGVYMVVIGKRHGSLVRR